MNYSEFLDLNKTRKKNGVFPAANILDINKSADRVLVTVDSLGVRGSSLKAMTIPELMGYINSGDIAYIRNASKLKNWKGWY